VDGESFEKIIPVMLKMFNLSVTILELNKLMKDWKEIFSISREPENVSFVEKFMEKSSCVINET
jgi:hypothetical protein